MDAKEVANLFQFYRHELLNHLQVIQGYVKLGNTDKADEKMSNLFELLHHERNLLNMKIPTVFLWMLTCNMNDQQYKVSCSIKFEGNLDASSAEAYIAECLEKTMEDIKHKYSGERVYPVHIIFKENHKKYRIEVRVNNEMESEFDLFPS